MRNSILSMKSSSRIALNFPLLLFALSLSSFLVARQMFPLNFVKAHSLPISGRSQFSIHRPSKIFIYLRNAFISKHQFVCNVCRVNNRPTTNTENILDKYRASHSVSHLYIIIIIIIIINTETFI